jgi:hypothetical protein
VRRRDGRRLPERCWIADRTTSAKRSISVWTAATGMSVCASVPAVPHIGVPDGMTESPLHHDHPPRVGIFSPNSRLAVLLPNRVRQRPVLASRDRPRLFPPGRSCSPIRTCDFYWRPLCRNVEIDPGREVAQREADFNCNRMAEDTHRDPPGSVQVPCRTSGAQLAPH